MIFRTVVLTIGILLLTIILTTYLSSRKIKSLTAIKALREGLDDFNFKKNYLPLAKHQGNLTITLAFKNMLMDLKKNIIVFIMTGLVAFVGLFALMLYYNIGVNDQAFLGAIAGELPDMVVQANDKGDIDEIQGYLEENNQVDQAIKFDQRTVTSKGLNIEATITDDFNMTDNKTLYEGRSPKYENEVVINGILAKNEDLNIGDTIYIKIGSREESYLITGFVQSANNAGRDMQMTREGYRRLDPGYELELIYVYLKNPNDARELSDEVKDEFQGEILDVMLLRDQANASLNVFKDLALIFAISILVLTGLIIALTLYLTISTSIRRQRKNFGIQKALGFTGYQIMAEVIISFLAITILGAILGSLLGKISLNPIIEFLFKNLGVVQVDFMTPMLLLLIIIAFITIFSILASIVITGNIKRISPTELFEE